MGPAKLSRSDRAAKGDFMRDPMDRMTSVGGWIPSVEETTSRGSTRYDIFSRLLKERIVFVSGGIDDVQAAIITAQLLFLESENPKREISMYINSPGGYVTAGLAIYDTMQYIRSPIATVCIGLAASMGSLLLAAGEKGMRICLPNARVMLHQPSGGFRGPASDIERHAEDILHTKRRLNEIYVKHTSQPYDTVERTLDRDFFLTATEAKAWGIVDNVYEKREAAEA